MQEAKAQLLDLQGANFDTVDVIRPGLRDRNFILCQLNRAEVQEGGKIDLEFFSQDGGGLTIKFSIEPAGTEYIRASGGELAIMLR